MTFLHREAGLFVYHATTCSDRPDYDKSAWTDCGLRPVHIDIRHELYAVNIVMLWARHEHSLPFRPRPCRSTVAVLLLLLLTSGDIQINPGPNSTVLTFGNFNIRSAVHKAAIIHDIINSYGIDLLAVSEIWIDSGVSPAIKYDMAPQGYNCIHVHRRSEPDGTRRGVGLAMVFSDNIFVRSHTLSTTFKPTSFELQLLQIGSQSSPTTLVHIYRPPSTSLSTFIEELSDILSTIL